MLQLLAATTGVPRADLKLILKHHLAALDNAAWLPAADIAVDRYKKKNNEKKRVLTL